MACNLLLKGYPADEAAAAAGVATKTVLAWRRCSWWADVQVICRKTYGADMADEIRGSVARLVRQDDGPTVRWAGEKLCEEFKPAHLQVEHSGSIRTDLGDEARQAMIAALERVVRSQDEEAEE